MKGETRANESETYSFSYSFTDPDAYRLYFRFPG